MFLKNTPDFSVNSEDSSKLLQHIRNKGMGISWRIIITLKFSGRLNSEHTFHWKSFNITIGNIPIT